LRHGLVGFELTILPQPLECWDYRHVPPSLALNWFPITIEQIPTNFMAEHKTVYSFSMEQRCPVDQMLWTGSQAIMVLAGLHCSLEA
jgi:hypothetical protein